MLQSEEKIMSGGEIMNFNNQIDPKTDIFGFSRQVNPVHYLQLKVFDFATNGAVGDGAYYIHIPAFWDRFYLTEAHAKVITAGTTNTTDIQIANVTDAVDILSTKLTIDSAETGSNTAATAAVINLSNDEVAENDQLRIDVDAVSTTAPKGLIITLGFREFRV